MEKDPWTGPAEEAFFPHEGGSMKRVKLLRRCRRILETLEMLRTYGNASPRVLLALVGEKIEVDTAVMRRKSAQAERN